MLTNFIKHNPLWEDGQEFSLLCNWGICYRRADKLLAWPGRKQAQKHVRDARNFNKIQTRTVIKFLFLQGKASKEIHAILTETSACFLPGRAKDLSAPLYLVSRRPITRPCHSRFSGLSFQSILPFSMRDACLEYVILNYIWRRTQIVKALCIQFFHSSCNFLFFRSRYSP